MNRILFPILCLFLTAGSLSAQTLKAYKKAAESAFVQGDYYTALNHYGVALEVVPEDVSLWYKFAESARELSALRLADSAYTQVLLRTDSIIYHDALYKLAEIKKQLGQYRIAQEYYFEYANRHGEQFDSLGQRAVELGQECEWAEEVYNNPSEEYQARNLDSLGVLVNTGYSEFGAFEYDSTLYYTSYRFVDENDFYDPPRPYMKVLTSLNGGEQEGVLYDELNDPVRHTAYLAYNRDHSKAYYAQCDYVGFDEVVCELYERPVLENDSLGDPIKLPAPVNLSGFTSTQPSLGWDSEREEEVLFFVSDRPGSFGQTDIWYAYIDQEDGSIEEPQNLKAVNTTGAEVTPFFHQRSQTLYFSSDGHRGLGGYDIFSTEKVGSVWSAPEHLAPPISTPVNDVYYVLNEEGTGGYLASNRAGSLFFEETQEFCCFDIYQFERLVFNLNIFTFNDKTKDELPAVELELYELQDGELIPVAQGINPTDNDYTFNPDPGKVYVLYSSKENFLTKVDTIDLTDVDMTQGRNLDYNVFLTPFGADLLTLVYDDWSREPIPGATVRLIEEGGPETLKTNEIGNDFAFDLNRKKEYSIIVEHPNYKPDTVRLEMDPSKPEYAITQKVYLTPKPILRTLVYDRKSEDPLNGATVQLFEREDQIAIEKHPDDNQFDFKINPPLPYTIVVSKAGYHTDTVEIKIDPESRERIITQKVFLLKKSIVDFVPLYLYFDNDYPDPNNWKRTTSKTYKETYDAYMERKELFMDEYTKLKEGRERFLAEQQVKAFFEREVTYGKESLEEFSKTMLKYLEKGIKLEITITGYASPRASSEYNLRLGSRRISSLRNHFNTWEEGALKEYIDSGQLIVKELSEGDRKVPEDVREQLKDEIDSIYSPTASVERRVEIIGVTVDENQ
jgi:tetratricopeptide (TPR) repeat protein